MKWNFPLVLIVICVIGSACNSPNRKLMQKSAENKIIAYIYPANEIIDTTKIDVVALTHINYSFAKIENGKIALGFPTDSINLALLKLHIEALNSNCKLLVSVGGWEFSDQFSDIALYDSSRKLFVKSAIEFVNTFRLDGLDIDWEYPGQAGKTNNFRPEDKQNFTLLLKELRNGLDSLGNITNEHYITTIAAPSFPVFYSQIEINEVVKELDFINLMAYDFFGEWDPVSGHQSNLFSVNNPKSLSTDSAINYLLHIGIPPQKIVVGIPFYSRSWKISELNSEGINRLGQGAGINCVYEDLLEKYINRNGYISYWDTSAAVPYLWNDSLHIFITYENPKSVELKCAYIQDKKLAGVMFWKYNLQNENLLLNVIDKHLNGTQ